ISSTFFADADVRGARRAVGEPALSFAPHGELLPENSSRWLRNPGNVYARGNRLHYSATSEQSQGRAFGSGSAFGAGAACCFGASHTYFLIVTCATRKIGFCSRFSG